MSARPLLEGAPDPAEVTRLRREIIGLEAELKTAKDEAAKVKRDSADALQAIRALQSMLEPFHKAINMIFGEISRVDLGELASPASPGAAPSGRDPRWESWKQKLGGKQAEFIELLLEHQEMTAAQLAAAAKVHRDTCYQIIHKLSRAGILAKNGGRFSLKL
jgi:hypothetical protein